MTTTCMKFRYCFTSNNILSYILISRDVIQLEYISVFSLKHVFVFNGFLLMFRLQTFVVEVIQFRNAFDAQGPAVPGIPPSEAVSRLQDFQARCTHYDAKRRTLDSVSKLFGIPCKPFPELDRTGEV